MNETFTTNGFGDRHDDGKRMKEVFDEILDRTRSRLNLKRVMKIFGLRKRWRKSDGTTLREQLVFATPVYDQTVFNWMERLREGMGRAEGVSFRERSIDSGREAIGRETDAMNRRFRRASLNRVAPFL